MEAMRHISDIYARLSSAPRCRLAVAEAADADVLQAVAAARELGIVDAVLFGDADAITACLEQIGQRPSDYEVRACSGPEAAALEAVRCVSQGKADILMKGLLPSSAFIRAVLNKEFGLRREKSVLSAVAVLEIQLEGETRLLFLMDPGFVPLPDLETKKAMLRELTEHLHLLGYPEPKIAVLSAMETVNPKILSSGEAKALEEMNQRGEIPGCIIGGPFSMDLALSRRSAEHKRFHHPVAGQADAILVPSLEVGNAVLKAVSYLAPCPQAGFVCGTAKPVVFTSRSDSAETKKNTIALAALLAAGRERNEEAKI